MLASREERRFGRDDLAAFQTRVPTAAFAGQVSNGHAALDDGTGFTLHRELELYVDYGHGFHSNDVRGAFGAQPVTPLVRAIGEEIGMRGRFWNRFPSPYASGRTACTGCCLRWGRWPRCC